MATWLTADPKTLWPHLDSAPRLLLASWRIW